MFSKENGKRFVTVLVASMVALAVHQTLIAPMLTPKKK